MGRGLEVDVGSRYDSLLFANTMKMLGTMDEKLKNHLIFRLCHSALCVQADSVVNERVVE